jgi:hypothetical protein
MTQSTQLLVGVFAISVVLHIFLQHNIAQCHRLPNQTFYAGWFTAGWPYALAYVSIIYVLPQMLMWFGFGPLGVIYRSIAAWIQSVYGISSIFSLLQSIGARSGVSNPLLKSIGLGSILQAAKHLLYGHDYIARCVNYYETWVVYLNMMDLAFVICYAIYRFFTRRR